MSGSRTRAVFTGGSEELQPACHTRTSHFQQLRCGCDKSYLSAKKALCKFDRSHANRTLYQPCSQITSDNTRHRHPIRRGASPAHDLLVIAVITMAKHRGSNYDGDPSPFAARAIQLIPLRCFRRPQLPASPVRLRRGEDGSQRGECNSQDERMAAGCILTGIRDLKSKSPLKANAGGI